MNIKELGGCWFCEKEKWYIRLVPKEKWDKEIQLNGESLFGCNEHNTFGSENVRVEGSSAEDALMTIYKARENGVSIGLYSLHITDGKLIAESANRSDKYEFIKLANSN